MASLVWEYESLDVPAARVPLMGKFLVLVEQ